MHKKKEKEKEKEEEEDLMNNNEFLEEILNNVLNKEENAPLISKEDEKEKDHLIQILKRLEGDLEKNKDESINDVYNQFLNNEDITKRNIKENINDCLLHFMFFFISPVLGIINLIGIFQIISVMKTVNEILFNSLKYYFIEDKEEKNPDFYEKKFNFFKIFFKKSENQSIDFNLMMFTAFIGNLLLISRGFRISSFVFMIINCFSLFLLLKFDFEAFRDEYDFFSILYLALCYILLLIGVGASALLSQQILVDSHQKYKQYIFKNKKIELKNEEKKKEMKSKSNNEGSINQNDYEEEDIIDDLNNKESESNRIKIKKYDYDEVNKDFERKEEAIKKKEKNN